MEKVSCLDFHDNEKGQLFRFSIVYCNLLPVIVYLPQVWDLRERRCLYTMPAHSSLVSSCRYERGCGGAYIVTGGYDSLVKVS